VTLRSTGDREQRQASHPDDLRDVDIFPRRDASASKFWNGKGHLIDFPTIRPGLREVLER
jgi:hypothetical protein